LRRETIQFSCSTESCQHLKKIKIDFNIFSFPRSFKFLFEAAKSFVFTFISVGEWKIVGTLWLYVAKYFCFTANHLQTRKSSNLNFPQQQRDGRKSFFDSISQIEFFAPVAFDFEECFHHTIMVGNQFNIRKLCNRSHKSFCQVNKRSDYVTTENCAKCSYIWNIIFHVIMIHVTSTMSLYCLDNKDKQLPSGFFRLVVANYWISILNFSCNCIWSTKKCLLAQPQIDH
jgi:hypothetical protein